MTDPAQRWISLGLAIVASLLIWHRGVAAEKRNRSHHDDAGCWPGPGVPCEPFEGSWFWLRSPEEERRLVAALYNRYCIRCHGVDGRGVWDIPDVPDFSNARWQASRSDPQLTRLIVQGRGAVMPAFRGTLTLEQSWALARYLRTFVPGTEVSRPDLRAREKANKKKTEGQHPEEQPAESKPDSEHSERAKKHDLGRRRGLQISGT